MNKAHNQTDQQIEVSIDVRTGLERQMTVTIADPGIEQQIAKRLRDIAKTARIQGFRPGKAPFQMIARRYQDQVEAKLMGDLIQSSYAKALAEKSIVPAGRPTLQSQSLKEGRVFQYQMIFEVYPDIELNALEQITVEKPVVSITEEDVEKMITTITKQHADWEKTDRACQEGDRVKVDFSGTIAGKSFPGSVAKDMELIIGPAHTPDNFEHHLLGLKTNEQKCFDLRFSDDHPQAAIAGKTAQFNVTLCCVSQPVLPIVNDEFVRRLGIKDGGVEQLRKEVKANMQRELDQSIGSTTKKQLLDELLKHHPIEPPKALVDDDMAHVQESLQRRSSADPAHIPDPLPETLLREQSRRRVQLGLLIAHVIKKYDIQLDVGQVDSEIKAIAMTYENPQAIEQAYRERQDLRKGLEASVMENQAVDTLLEQVKVQAVDSSFYDIVQNKG